MQCSTRLYIYLHRFLYLLRECFQECFRFHRRPEIMIVLFIFILITISYHHHMLVTWAAADIIIYVFCDYFFPFDLPNKIIIRLGAYSAYQRASNQYHRRRYLHIGTHTSHHITHFLPLFYCFSDTDTYQFFKEVGWPLHS